VLAQCTLLEASAKKSSASGLKVRGPQSDSSVWHQQRHLVIHKCRTSHLTNSSRVYSVYVKITTSKMSKVKQESPRWTYTEEQETTLCWTMYYV